MRLGFESEYRFAEYEHEHEYETSTSTSTSTSTTNIGLSRSRCVEYDRLPKDESLYSAGRQENRFAYVTSFGGPRMGVNPARLLIHTLVDYSIRHGILQLSYVPGDNEGTLVADAAGETFELIAPPKRLIPSLLSELAAIGRFGAF